MFFHQSLNFQANQLVQAHFQNGRGLALRKAKLPGVCLRALEAELNLLCLSIHQAFLGIPDVFGTP